MLTDGTTRDREPNSADRPEGQLRQPLTLRATHVTVRFAGVTAVDAVDLTLGEGEILGLIGPNGAGKTTLVNVLSGFAKPTEGTLELSGAAVTGVSPQAMARRGVVRTFQSVRLFDGLSILDNVALGAVGVGTGRREAYRIAADLLERLGVSEDTAAMASGLPHGDARRVAVARALAARPRLVLLDEPAAGLDEAESVELTHALLALQQQLGCGLLVIEHDMRVIMRLCQRIQVLDYGKTIFVGTPEATSRDPGVRAAYLGTGA